MQNARLVANAERYYRVMYYGSRESWNLRDQHMFDTLRAAAAFRGRESKVVVWEHNSHVGDAAATEMGARGEHNIGHLCRQSVRRRARTCVGFGTDHGTVAAAHDWDEPMEVMQRAARRMPRATSACATIAVCRPSCCRCATRAARRSARS